MHLPPVCASNRLVAMASISSINIIAGAFSLASLNTSLTIRGPSPKYFWTNSEPTTLMKAAKTKTSVKLFVNQYTVICTLLAKEITKIHGFIIQYNLILSLIERRVCKFWWLQNISSSIVNNYYIFKVKIHRSENKSFTFQFTCCVMSHSFG